MIGDPGFTIANADQFLLVLQLKLVLYVYCAPTVPISRPPEPLCLNSRFIYEVRQENDYGGLFLDDRNDRFGKC